MSFTQLLLLIAQAWVHWIFAQPGVVI